MEVREQMMGGRGSVQIRHILNSGEAGHSCRLFARVVLEPGGSIGFHEHHKETEVYYVLRGTGTADHNGEAQRLEPGTVMAIGDGMSHSICNDGDDQLEFLAVIIMDG